MKLASQVLTLFDVLTISGWGFSCSASCPCSVWSRAEFALFLQVRGRSHWGFDFLPSNDGYCRAPSLSQYHL